MKNPIVIIAVFVVFSVFSTGLRAQNKDKEKINFVLDGWHKAAAEANYDSYFSMMTPDAVFIGTDATENWNKANFKVWAKPYFDRGNAWNFTMLERHIYLHKSGKMAWFDELLNTQMKVCRGSGVLVKIGTEWKIQHYVLSMTIPNDDVNAVVKIKAPIEEALIRKLKEQ